MTSLDERSSEPTPEKDDDAKRGHGHWMMVACCIPMLAIALIIALSGAGFGFFIVALGCLAMMTLMMGGMMHSGDNDRR